MRFQAINCLFIFGRSIKLNNNSDIGNMQESNLQQAKNIYISFIQSVQFSEIEHVPDNFMVQSITVQQNCLCIAHKFFKSFYPCLMKELINTPPQKLKEQQWIAQILLVMNGENQKAWNCKKYLLEEKQLNIDREIKFNAAVCIKNKKSSIYYEYRIKLYSIYIKSINSKEKLLQLYQSQNAFIKRILQRFFRNYYCWNYRNRLFQLFKSILGSDFDKVEIKLLHSFIEVNPNDYSAYSRLISVVKNQNKDSLLQEEKWSYDLKQFCILAYEHKQSYNNIDTYLSFLGKMINSSE